MLLQAKIFNNISATHLVPILSGCIFSRYHLCDVLLPHIFTLSFPSLITFLAPSPFCLFFFSSPLMPLSPMLGEGLSSSRLSLHKPGATSSDSNLPQRRESRVSVLLNHLLPSSSSNTGHSPGSPGSSILPTPQNSPACVRFSSRNLPCTHGAGHGPQGIPEVVVSPPEDDDPLSSTEEETATPQLNRRASSASQGLEMLALEGKYLCSLPV